MQSKFHYTLSDIEPNSTDKNVERVQFDVGRYGGVTHCLHFHHPVTDAQAIRTVEHWLSQPITADERNHLIEVDDVLVGDDCEKYKYRYEALGCCTILESITREGTKIFLVCGS